MNDEGRNSNDETKARPQATPPDILTAKDPDLRASYAAMRRAAMLARKVAIQTDTGIVIVKDGQLTFVDAKTLREQAEAQKDSTA